MNRELREWLGLTWADLLVYLALAAAVGLFFVKDATADIALAATAIILAAAACPLGMKRDPAVSEFTNGVKLMSYPLYLLLIIAAVAAHYAWFSP